MPLVLIALGAGAYARPARAQISRQETQRIARDHFRLGAQYYQQGRFAEAAREFESVYDVSQQIEMLFNAGRAYEAAGDSANALRAYQLFLDRGSPSMDPAQVHARIDAIHAAQSAPAANANNTTNANATNNTAANPTPTAGTSSTAQPSTLLQLRFVRVEYRRGAASEYGPFVAMGLGLVLGGLAVWQGVAANSDTTLYNQANTGMVAWGPDVQRAYGSAPTESVAATGLGVAGGVFLLAGVGWLLFRGPGERHEVMESASITPVPGGAVFTVGGAL